jgi:beta-glucanase (GH16 family)
VQHESDIEILTTDSTGIVHYTTHPEDETHEDGGYPIAVTMPNGAQWTDFQDYRMDWTQPTTIFYVNGAQNGQLQHVLPQVSSYLCFNMWGQGNDHGRKVWPLAGLRI